LAKKESDVVTMTEALETALKAHPVGLLTPKRKRFHPGQRVEFLGHYLIPQPDGKIRVEPSEENWKKFENDMRWQLKRLKYKSRLPPHVFWQSKRPEAMFDLGWLHFAFATGSACTRNTG
jgi:hypothetical protein